MPKSLYKLNILFDLLSKGLPKELYISTISLNIKIEATLCFENIFKYMYLKKDKLETIEYSNNKKCYIRTLNKNMENEINKKKKLFYNEITLHIKSKKYKSLKIKLFKNGNIQIPGCCNMEHCFETLKILYDYLISDTYIYKSGKIHKILFANKESKKKLKLNQSSYILITMINCKFNVNFKINRIKLYDILTKKNIEAKCIKSTHAAVIIKYKYDKNSKISIIVFQVGVIIITAAKKYDHILKAYYFINKLLYDNYYEIVYFTIEEIISEEEIKEIENKK